MTVTAGRFLISRLGKIASQGYEGQAVPGGDDAGGVLKKPSAG